MYRRLSLRCLWLPVSLGCLLAQASEPATSPSSTEAVRAEDAARLILVEGADWEMIGSGYQWAEGLAITADGTLYLSDVRASKIYRVRPGGKPELFVNDSGKANGLALGPDGRLYGACNGVRKILAWDLQSGKPQDVARGFSSNDLVVLHNGSIYVTDPESKQVWHVHSATGQAKPVDVFPGCNGITASPDQTQLYVAHFPGQHIYSYQIAADGRLSDKLPLFQLQLPPGGKESHADGMCVSAEGWLLSATEAGIQICDQAGQVKLVLPRPGTGRRVCYVRLHEQTLYAATADAVWKRPVKITAAKPFEPPVVAKKPEK